MVAVPESVHHVEVLKPKTWLVPASSFSNGNIGDNSGMEKQPAWSKTSAITSTVKQRQLTFFEKIIVTVVSILVLINRLVVYHS